MLIILMFIPGDYAGPCFIGFAIGESLGAAALRVAGGIFTKIADIGADMMKIVFKIKEDDARNPGVIADCTGDNAGDSVGPSADGFETYGVTGVALITFILLAVKEPTVQIQLLVWIFMMRVMMVLASVGSYFINERRAKSRYNHARHFNFESPLTFLVWLTSIISILLTYVFSAALIPTLGGDDFCGGSCRRSSAAARWPAPSFRKWSRSSPRPKAPTCAKWSTSSKEGGASLNILSGLVAGNFSAYWLGMIIAALMGIAYLMSTMISERHDARPVRVCLRPGRLRVSGHGPGDDCRRQLWPGDRQRPVGLRALDDRNLAEHPQEIEHDFGFMPDFELAKDNLEKNDGAGNTFKATAKPVLVGTAVVGATTMIFSIVLELTHGLQPELLANLSILYPPFLLGMIAGGAVIFWFSGASIQAVTTGAYRAVEFIKENINLGDSAETASTEDSIQVVAICTEYAQTGTFNIFIVVFFSTLGFAFLEPYLFIGYLVSIALFGLYQAIFMANAGGAWDNAKKVVETELKAKNTPLHEATVVGDTVGDPFKDTTSVALNPIIKFTTLFGLLAVPLAVSLRHKEGEHITLALGGRVSGDLDVLRAPLVLRHADSRRRRRKTPQLAPPAPRAVFVPTTIDGTPRV